jgi:hypothetical protein
MLLVWAVLVAAASGGFVDRMIAHQQATQALLNPTVVVDEAAARAAEDKCVGSFLSFFFFVVSVCPLRFVRRLFECFSVGSLCESVRRSRLELGSLFFSPSLLRARQLADTTAELLKCQSRGDSNCVARKIRQLHAQRTVVESSRVQRKAARQAAEASQKAAEEAARAERQQKEAAQRESAEAEQQQAAKERKLRERDFDERERRQREKDREERRRIRKELSEKYERKLKALRDREVRKEREAREEAKRLAEDARTQRRAFVKKLVGTLKSYDGKRWKKRTLTLRAQGDELAAAGMPERQRELREAMREERHALARIRREQGKCETEDCVRKLQKKVKVLAKKQRRRIGSLKKELKKRKDDAERAKRAAEAGREEPPHKSKRVKRLGRSLKRLQRLDKKRGKALRQKVGKLLKHTQLLLKRKRECNGELGCVAAIQTRQKAAKKHLKRLVERVRKQVLKAAVRKARRLVAKLKKGHKRVARRASVFLDGKMHAAKRWAERKRACVERACRKKAAKAMRGIRRLLLSKLQKLSDLWAKHRLHRLVSKLKRLAFMQTVARAADSWQRHMKRSFRHLRQRLRSCGRDKACRKEAKKRLEEARKKIKDKIRELRKARLDAIVDQEKRNIAKVQDKDRRRKLEDNLKRNVEALDAVGKQRAACRDRSSVSPDCSRKKFRSEEAKYRNAIRDGLGESAVAVAEEKMGKIVKKLAHSPQAAAGDKARAETKSDEERLALLGRYEKECDGKECSDKVRKEMDEVRERIVDRADKLQATASQLAVDQARAAIANLTVTRSDSSASASADLEKKLHSLHELESRLAECATPECSDRVRAEIAKVQDSLDRVAQRTAEQANGTTSEQWRDEPTVTDQLERVIELLRYVQPEIASAASYTLWEERHKLDRLEHSKRDCESNACFHGVLRKIEHIKRVQQRELTNLRHVLNSGSSSVVRRIRKAISSLRKTHPTVAKEAQRRLEKRVRKVRKLWRKKWEPDCHDNPACVTRVLEKVKAVWAEERLQLRELEKSVLGTPAKRAADAIAALQRIDAPLAGKASAILARLQSELKNLTVAMAECRDNSACKEDVGEKQRMAEERIKELLRTVQHNSPHPLGNVTHLVREAGLQSLADSAHQQFFEEGKELERIETERMDCQDDACVARLDLMEEKINAERDHRLKLLETALGNAPRAAVVVQDFPERTLMIVLVVVLAVMVLGLLVMLIALGGYWWSSAKKDKPRIVRRPSSEWEWREK